MFIRALLICWLSFNTFAFPQDGGNYRIRTVAFYNTENLFDIVNDSLTFDDQRTPDGKDGWNAVRYQLKIGHIAKVLSEVGREKTGSSPDLIGLCEIENYAVLEDLTTNIYLAAQDYGIIHYDSPDERGIDVALLYKKGIFLPDSFKSHRLLLFNEEGERDYSRDQLVVGGWLDNEYLYLLVNHWPSRSGGALRSRPFRKAAALLNKRILDSLLLLDPDAKIINMGDFNDNPVDPSLKKTLKVGVLKDSLQTPGLYNPMELFYKKGFGTLAYRDEWSLFDQIFFTRTLLSKDFKTYSFWKAGIYRPDYLITPHGRYKGYPYRTYASGVYTGGYSDHFPVYAYFIKKEE